MPVIRYLIRLSESFSQKTNNFSKGSALKSKLPYPILRGFACLFAGLLFLASSAHADSVSLGVLSFNTLIPGTTGSPGVNDFAIDNFTGYFSLPPDFPVNTPLQFTNSSITLTFQGGSRQTITLGNLGPASYTPSSLQFSALTNFTSAVFTATLNPTTFSLATGSLVRATASQISVSLTPLSGTVLTPDADFAPINVSITPEPSTGVIMVAALASGMWLRRRCCSQS